jgi:alpha-beta hydrolase superfamily lysophospholipase
MRIFPGLKQSHFLPDRLTAGVGTLAHWSGNPAGKLIVFVHGFIGHATDTWLDFPGMLTADSRARDVDVVFYGYDALYRQAGTSAALFREFLTRLVEPPHDVGQSVQRPPAPPYDHVVIVAHSLGAVISRRALLDLGRARKPWVQSLRLVLFAPAHSGSYAAAITSAALSSQGWQLLKLAASAAQYKLPLLTDLQKGSVVLTRLEQDTRRALDAAPDQRSHLVPDSVIWANDDLVVINAPFCDDPLEKPWEGNHTSICKPTSSFRDPVEAVLAAL